MESVASLIDSGTAILRDAGIPEPRREASSLLELAIRRDRTFVIAHPDHACSIEEIARYREFVGRRAGREPFHYITGVKEFYGLNFAVSPAVLIPRPETEMLVERGIQVLSDKEKPVFCEVGVGSGCISIALLVYLPRASGVALDISPQALEIAKANSREHNVAPRLDLRLSDLFEEVAEGETFDLIVSNPPYVPAVSLDGLQPEVRDHEPPSALTDGGDGLSIIRRIVLAAPDLLKRGGTLMVEFGVDQSGPVRAMFSPDVWASVRFLDDLQGIQRTVEAVPAK